MYTENIPFEEIENVRDLGFMPTRDGKTIKPGLLFRGADPESASDSDIKKFDALGIKYIIDLRTTAEFNEGHASDEFTAKLVHFPLNYEEAKGITRERKTYDDILTEYANLTRLNPTAVRDSMAGLYLKYVEKEYCRGKLHEIVSFILECNAPVYWHCAGGKDRTGIVAVILQEIFNVSHENIVADYLFSNECKKQGVENELKHVRQMFDDDEEYRLRETAINYTWYAHEAYIENFYNAAIRNYGSMDNFITNGIGISETEKNALRERFLQ